MNAGIQLLPEQASTFASHVDAFYLALVAICTLASIIVVAFIVAFAVKYRNRSGDWEPFRTDGLPHALHQKMELVWIAVPMAIFLGIFVWASYIYAEIRSIPKDAMDVYVVGKRWMWKIQHPNGKREINQLHVPVNRSVKLTMSTEDVLHSFYIPAFRIKQDVVPGRYTYQWFKATQPGEYHLFCAEYCGTKHSQMIGSVVVMEQDDYNRWLETSGGSGAAPTMATGEQLVKDLGCMSCHTADGVRAPKFEGLFGSTHELADGSKLTVDAEAIRSALYTPMAQVYKGYPPIMPPFKGQVDEVQLLQIIGYLKSIGSTDASAPAAAPAAEAAGSAQPATPEKK